MEKTEIDRKLRELPRLKAKKMEEARIARKAAKEAKAVYELKAAQIHYTLKLQNSALTQTDLKAQATIGSHQQRLDMILADAAWKKISNEVTSIEDEFAAVLEASYGWRAEVKAGFNGGNTERGK